MHGGLQVTLLDEAMGLLLAMSALQPAYTASMKMDFVRPLKFPCEVFVAARLKSDSGRKLYLDAELASAPPTAAAPDPPTTTFPPGMGARAATTARYGKRDRNDASLFARCDALFVQPRDHKAKP